MRPGTGVRAVQLERESGAGFGNDGGRIRTDSAGYFATARAAPSSYRFVAYDGTEPGAGKIGISRIVQPVP